MFLSHFHKVLPKPNVFWSIFLICAWKHFTKRKVFLFKFCIKFYWNKCVSVNILICTCKKSIKTLCFVRKNSKNCAWLKVFLSHFHKGLPKQMCFGQYFNMCMETFYQNKVFLFKFFIKFYWNKCVSISILICAWKNSTKTLCFGRKKTAELCLIKSVSVTFS